MSSNTGAFRSFSTELQQLGLKAVPKKSAREKERDFVSLGKAPLPAVRFPGAAQRRAQGQGKPPVVLQGPSSFPARCRAPRLDAQSSPPTPNPGKCQKRGR